MRYGKGPIGALLDEYERAMEEFIALVLRIDPAIYTRPVNSGSENKDCETIAGVCFHVLFAGYAYANAISRVFSLTEHMPERVHPSQSDLPEKLRAMLHFTEKALEDKFAMTDADLVQTRVPVRWSDHHDLESLLQHAIVHILRHRRQIEFLLSRPSVTP